ncbi:MAG: CHAT domain-containing protein [Cyanobacteria bacterium P01_E01_bin.6]
MTTPYRDKTKVLSYFLTIIGLCTVSLSHASSANSAQPIPIAQLTDSRSLENFTGELSSRSSILEDDGSYYETHTFEGTAGEAITIELTSEEFDTYLILLSSNGTRLAHDNDGAEGTNSRITVTLRETGIYMVLVNSFEANQVGGYNLELRAATERESNLALAAQLSQQGLDLLNSGRYEEAFPLAERVVNILEEELGAEHLDTAIGLHNLGFLQHLRGMYEESEQLYLRALDIRKQYLGFDHPDTLSIMDDLAFAYTAMGNFVESEALSLQVLSIREQNFPAGNPQIASTLHRLAVLYRSSGRYEEAESFFRRALFILERDLGLDHLETAGTMNSLAEVYRLMGRYREAEPLYLQALAIAEEKYPPNHPNTATALSNLATLYDSTNRYREAEEIYFRAIGITEQLGSQHPLHGTVLNNLAAHYVSRGYFAVAEPLYLYALEITEQLGPEHPLVSKSLNNLAGLYMEMGRYEEAESLLVQSLSIAEKQLGPSHPFTATALLNLSSVNYLEGRSELALDFLNQALKVQETVLSNNFVSGSDASKRDFLDAVSITTNTLISLNLREFLNDPEATQLALDTILQRKGRILDFFTNIRTSLSADADSASLLDNLRISTNQLSTILFNPPRNVPVESYQAEIELLQNNIRTLEEQLSQRSSEFAELTNSPSWNDIRKQLSNGTALVEYIRYRNIDSRLPQPLRHGAYHYAAYILQSDGTIHSIDLGPAEAINAAVQDLSSSLTSSDTPLFQVKEEAQALERLVMAPVRAALGDTTTLFLSPDSALNLIPFESLVDESGNYLVETYQFRYLTSGRDLMRLDNTNASSNPALLIGNPTYGRSGEQVAQADTSAQTNTRGIDFENRIFPSLSGTQTEVDRIATLLPGITPYTGTDATEALLKQQDQPNLMHIATHGFFEATEESFNPLLQSGLILAGASLGQSGPDQDGILTALEVTGLNLRGTQLVVLSACETGLGELAAGEGVYGLRRALVLAGSQSQVISLWKVNDTATQELMVEYYDRLLSGTPRDAALRETQLAFLESEEYSHPYYWAAFIGSGDWRPLE